ncbi:MAG: hypothetical protein JWM11_3481 [Planctomycetaceae bacterium]|nr:hypothetical protein [Planctomycetaceae bacterium]
MEWLGIVLLRERLDLFRIKLMRATDKALADLQVFKIIRWLRGRLIRMFQDNRLIGLALLKSSEINSRNSLADVEAIRIWQIFN